MEFLVVIAVFAYIFYLKNYADLRSKSEKEEAGLKEGIALYTSGHTEAAFAYFEAQINASPKSSVAYLYRGLCYKAMGNRAAAARDYQAGLSFDDQVYQLHLESGKLLLEQNEIHQALTSLNSAIRFASERDPEPYRQRARAHALLDNQEAAAKDFDHAAALAATLSKMPPTGPGKTPLLDRRLLINLIMVTGTSAILVVVVKNAESIHLPYLVAVLSAISIGFAEPHRGWLLAIFQCMLLLAGYFLFTKLPESGSKQELENFCLYGSMILTLAASFLGAFLKRALNMN
ncbi:hypothetical protein [Dyadobacter sandarakinus]|uniref:Tetratricopeptide repeat protein n=1 Tax=Dyadobacter sandarakinus TaxID=2747268 RepID=A0ABX7I1I1_9BACT|nr:hypothetical protein [Dyadobacter sandarakinus]QRQ99935.1 hypothetical protein HWI92_02895 [Dyadobacter sandarakinus]